MMIKIFLLVLVNIPVILLSATPSFNCDYAKAYVEKRMCSNNILANLDNQLAYEYDKVIKALPLSKADILKEEESKWVRTRNRACDRKNDSCIEKYLHDRIIYLRSYKARNPMDSDLQLRKYDASREIGMPFSMVVFGGKNTPLCKLAISNNGKYFFLKKVSSSCVKLTNSKGIKIICNSNKTVCKTRSELINFVQNHSYIHLENNYISNNNARNSVKKKTRTLHSLMQKFSYSEIFDIKTKGSSSSNEFHNFTEEKLPIMKGISEISGDFKTINIKFQVRSKYNLTGSYKVKVKFNTTQLSGMKSNLLNGWLGTLASGIGEVKERVQYHTFYLNSRNSYSDTEIVKFKLVGVSVNALGVNMRTNIISYKITGASIVDVEQID